MKATVVPVWVMQGLGWSRWSCMGHRVKAPWGWREVSSWPVSTLPLGKWLSYHFRDMGQGRTLSRGYNVTLLLPVIWSYGYTRTELKHQETEMRKGSPEAPAIYCAGEHHIALLGGEVQLRVVGVLQASAPVIHLIALFGMGLHLGFCLSLCSFF